LRCRRPSSSILFPYTTLFRSKMFTSWGNWKSALMLVTEPSSFNEDACMTAIFTFTASGTLLEISPGHTASGHSFLYAGAPRLTRSEEHTSELQSRRDLVCRLL